ncbi:MAG: hypothetical protein ACOYXS_08945 [Chloroflexota bacterium]
MRIGRAAGIGARTPAAGVSAPGVGAVAPRAVGPSPTTSQATVGAGQNNDEAARMIEAATAELP